MKISEEELVPVDQKSLMDKISDVLNSFISNNFSEFIKNLIKLRTEALTYNPEQMNLGLVDLLMDENMWNWVSSTIEKDPTEFDWEAAGYVAADLKDILENNNTES